MNRMRKTNPIWRTVLVLGLAVVLITTGLLAGGRLQRVQGWFAGIFVPVQRAYTGAVQRVNRYFLEQAREKQLQAEFNLLSDQVTLLTIKSWKADEANREIERLNSLLGVTTQYPEFDLRKAKVIGKGSGTFFSTFSIDLGTKDGVEPNMAVITRGGLVGRVTDVYDNFSNVMSIIDGRSSVGGLIERTRDNGMVHGSLNLSENDDTCRMEYLPFESEPAQRDRVLTSGLDGVYPKGLLIGEVMIVATQDQSSQYLVIKPGVDFRHLEEVLVVFSDRVSHDDNLGVEDSE